MTEHGEMFYTYEGGPLWPAAGLWVAVTERMPEGGPFDSREVLIRVLYDVPGETIDTVALARWSMGQWRGEKNYEPGEVTHWAEIHAPETETKGTG